MTPPFATPESVAAPELAREMESRGAASGWGTSMRMTITLVCVLGAGAFVWLWIYGQAMFQVTSLRLPTAMVLISSYHGQLSVTVSTGLSVTVSSGNASFDRRWLPGFPITHTEFDPPEVSGLPKGGPEWNAGNGGLMGPGAWMQCPCWFAVGLWCVVGLGVFPWKRFRARSRGV